MTRAFGSRLQPGAFFFLQHPAQTKNACRKALWKRPPLWKSIKVAFGNFFLMISTSCLETPSQKPLRLSHRYHSADGDPLEKAITNKPPNTKFRLLPHFFIYRERHDIAFRHLHAQPAHRHPRPAQAHGPSSQES